MARTKSLKWCLLTCITAIVIVLSLLGLFELIIRLFGLYQSPIEANGLDYFSAYETFGRKFTWTRPANTTISVNYQEFQYSFTTNSLGIRDVERDKENTQGRKRVLLLGDSFTESFGAADDSTVLVLMQSELDLRFPNHNVELMNGAVAGSDLFFNYLILENVLADYQPDLVLFIVNSTDLMDYCVRGGLERMQPDGSFELKPCPIVKPLYRNLHLYRFWVHDVLNRERGSFLTKRKSTACQADFSHAANEVFEKLEQLSLAKGFSYRIVYQPLAYEVRDGAYDTNLDPIYGPNTIDLLPSIKTTHFSIRTIYWPIDGHFTPKGYNLYANLLVNELVSQELLP
jgi:lysophospholipase L1-like esterase